MAREIFTYQGKQYSLPEGTSPELAEEKIRAHLAKKASIENPELEPWYKEFGEGILGGFIEMGSGVAQTGALAYDLANGTNYAGAIEDATNKFKAQQGIDPAGGVGTVTETLVQYLTPGLGVAGLIGKISKARKLGTALTRSAQVAGAGVADGIVYTDGQTTLGDFFGVGPTVSSKNVGQTGAEETGRQISNKFKIATEAAAATVAIPTALTTTAAALGATYYGVKKGMSPATAKLVEKYPMVDNILSYFRSRGSLPQNAFEEQSGIRGKIESETNFAGRVATSLEKEIDKIFKENETIFVAGEETDKVKFINSLYGYLTKDPSFVEQARLDAGRRGLTGLNFDSPEDLAKFLPESIQTNAINMRGQIDLLTRRIARSDFVNSGALPDIENIVTANLGEYMRRKYQIFEDANWINTPEFRQAKDEAVQFYVDNPSAAEELYTKTIGPAPENFTVGQGITTRTDRRFAEDAVDAFVRRYDSTGLFATGVGDGSRWRAARNKLRTSLLTRQQLQEPVLRSILGEVKDPLDTYVSTIADLAEFKATNDYYDYLAKNFVDVDDAAGAASRRDLLLSEEAAALLPKDILQKEYVQLGDTPRALPDDADAADISKMQGRDLSYGALQGTYARKDLHGTGGLTRLTLAQDHPAMKYTYGAYLYGKGAVQYNKTVLSPITQIRNVISAALFAAAQGNVGRGNMSVMESFKTVWNDISRGGDDAVAAKFREYQNLGVVGTQAQIREIETLLEEGLGSVAKTDLDSFGVAVKRRPGEAGVVTRTKQKLSKLPGAKSLSNFSNFMRQTYQGGDDVWKIYNYEFELGKLESGLGGRAAADEYARSVGFRNAKEYAADIVKNVVPNYERVPEAVRLLRKAPLGDFIAFPAEIIRTSANTLEYAIKELQSPNPAIRQIGLRRLVGFTTTAAVAGPATAELARLGAGVTKDAYDALTRTQPEWSQNNNLVITSVEEKKVDGKKVNVPRGYIDYDFINPYSYWAKVGNGILRAYNNGQLEGKDGGRIISDASAQVYNEMFAPFLDESIITERILDVTSRGGKTQDGRVIYRGPSGDFPGESRGNIAAKSFVHIASAFNPGFVEQLVGTVAPLPELGGELGVRKSRLLEAMLSPDGRDARGNIRETEDEIARLLTGVTEQPVEANKIMKYTSYEYKKAIREASAPYNRALRVENKLEPENLLEAYRLSNERKFLAQNQMYMIVQDMKALGMSRGEIQQALREHGVPNYKKLYAGIFEPQAIDKEELKKAIVRQRKVGGKIPTQELYAIQRQSRKENKFSILRRREERERSKEIPVSLFDEPQIQEQSVAAAVPPPAAAQAGAAPAQMAVPAPQTANLDPSLLGSGPEDILKNLQIQQRMLG